MRSNRLAPGCLAALAALGLVACVGGGRGRVDSGAKESLAKNQAALEQLRFGMSIEEAGSIMGRAGMTPPWANAWKIGPQVVENPLDTIEVESPSGESYTVHRYAIALDGEPNCPFVRGEATLAPLIFLDAELVGWRWSYLESALQRPLSAEERGFRFGGFCADPSNGASE